MKEVFIKYNPYKLETVITVNKNDLAKNSKLGEKIDNGARLQEWVEELPKLLVDEYNDNEFHITFHGTMLDFEDLSEVIIDAQEKGILNAILKHVKAKETADKERAIDKIFKEIQEGPFDELRDTEILNSFLHAKSSEFEVCVVATMSAGKSTLINSMLSDKLMPSKQEACTAIITRIKDNDSDSWDADVYNKNGKLIETCHELDYATMERLNADENVSTIKVNGNIPFVTSEDISLVLIDTPGPNNSRDQDHKKVQSEFLNKSSKSLILYIMEGTFGSDDDNSLLQRVAESMAVGGKQSKDRFIFVINKMDDRKKEDGDTAQTLERVREYLKRHGIVNPNLFPAAALPALNIRRIARGLEDEEDTIDETDVKVRKLNRNENLHFEKYAANPLSVKNKINDMLNEAIESENVEQQALIHSGIISLEASIRQYVQKYAKTAKIKNVSDTFSHKLEELKCFENTKLELVNNQESSDELANQISDLSKTISGAKEAQRFELALKRALEQTDKESKVAFEQVMVKFQSRISEKLVSSKGKEIELAMVDKEIIQLQNFAKYLEPELEVELSRVITQNLVDTSQAMLNQYKNKLATLTAEFNKTNIGNVKIDSLKLMSGSINLKNVTYENLVKSKQVEDGTEFVANSNKKWFKPWTWLEEDGYYKKIYKDVKYINASELAQHFLQPVQDVMYENADKAKEHMTKETLKISKQFESEFKRLDKELQNKLKELESYATAKDKADSRVKHTEEKLEWLKSISLKIENVLEI